jgi:signal transduction histidine kinase
VQVAAATTGAAGAALLLREPDEARLEPVAAIGLGIRAAVALSAVSGSRSSPPARALARGTTAAGVVIVDGALYGHALCAPVTMGEETVGVLAVVDPERRDGRSRRETLRALARAAPFEPELPSGRRRADRLVELASALAAAKTVADVAEAVASIGARDLGARRGVVVAAEPGGALRVAGVHPAGGRPPAGDEPEGALRALLVAVGVCARGGASGVAVFDLDGVPLDRSRRSYLAGLARLTARALPRASLFDRLEAAADRPRDSGERVGASISQHRLQALLDRLQIGIVVLRRPSLRVEYVNGNAREALGLPRLRAGTTLVDSWPEFSLREFVRRLSQSAGPRWVPLTLSGGRLVELTGRADGGSIILLLRDVTRWEREAHAAREFVAHASHELRAPLAAIAAATDALRLGAAADPRRRERLLDGIALETERLIALTHGLLLLTRVQSRPESLEPATVRVRPLLEAVAREVPVERQVDLRVRCNPRVSVHADRALLESALVNLVENASRHTKHGRIVLSGRPLPDGTVAIQVSDTGSGIAPEHVRHVFDDFYRDGESDGFGIGLPLVRRIARSLGGDVELRSQPGRGTAVMLTVEAAA